MTVKVVIFSNITFITQVKISAKKQPQDPPNYQANKKHNKL